MESKHTPGPWKIDGAEKLPLAIIRNDLDGEGVCEIGERTPENVANAKLISCAPEMLKALEKCYIEIRNLQTLAENEESALTITLKALIIKVKGK